MKCRKPNERKCIKFTGYLYIPDNTDNDYDTLRYYASHTAGVINIFDDKNKSQKQRHFDNVGKMLHLILDEYKKRAHKRVPTKAQLARV